MTIKVQRVPRELLALLGVVGDNPPASLLEDYRGTIEMMNLFIASLPIEQEFVNTTPTTAGSTAIVTVPTGEIWFVDGVQTSVGVNGTVTDALFETFWSGGLLAERAYINGATMAAGGGTETHGWAAAGGFPIVAKAGEDFTSRCSVLVGNAVLMTCLVRFRRIRA